MAEEDDIRRIEVELSLMSGQDSAAAKQLADSLASIAQMYKTIQAGQISLAAEIRNQSKLAGELNKQQQYTAQGKYVQGNNAMGRTPPKETLRQGADLAQYATEQASQIQDNNAGAPPIPPEPPKWQEKLEERRDLGKMGFKIPRYGQLTPQEYFSEISKGLERVAKQGENGEVGGRISGALLKGFSPEQLGNASAQFQRASNTVATLYGTYKGTTGLVRQVRGFLGNYEMDPTMWQNAGAQLGYERGGAALGFLPFANPFSPAGGQGFRQAINTLGAAMQPGVNLQQAKEITGAAAGYGLSGSRGSDVVSQLLTPLFQRFGMNPNQVLTDFGAGLRTGAQSIQNLNEQLSNLPKAAQSASMTLTDTMNAVSQASQVVQGLGGMPQQGQAFGIGAQTLTGLPATVSSTLLSNPLTQSIIAQQTGVMPLLQGSLPTSSLFNGLQGALSFAQRIFGRSFRDKTQQIKDPFTGKVLNQTDTAESQSNAMIAHMLGIDPQSVKRLMKDQGLIAAGNALTQGGEEVGGFGGEIGKYLGEVSGGGTNFTASQIQQLIHMHRGVATGGLTGRGQTAMTGMNGTVESVDNKAGTFTLRQSNGQLVTLSLRNLAGYNRGTNTSPLNQIEEQLKSQLYAGSFKDPNHIGFTDLEKAITQGHLWEHPNREAKRIQKVYKEQGGYAAATQLGKDTYAQEGKMNRQLAAGKEPSINIYLKGAAAKYLEAEGKNLGTFSQQLAASAGGAPINSLYATALGANPLIGQNPANTYE